MDQHGAVRLDQQEPGGEGEMGFEPANVINGAMGYDKSHAVQTIAWAPQAMSDGGAPGASEAAARSGTGEWAAWGRMDTCRVPTVPAVLFPARVPLPAGAQEERGAGTFPNWTWNGHGPVSPAARAPRTASGWYGP